ncbi:MAG: protein-L-isoaspartate(D-aspartate) O-methyltransferase [Candidatus Aminicenantes bacterium]|nr:protein-L-isoaspartate(D-aspartate) O-methyltransferase [Candidatus Aminicenantes bacterium]
MRNDFSSLREKMVEVQIAGRGIKNAKVLDAMGKVPRHFFVPEELRDSAYADGPLPIGAGQTISQPYIVAYMTEILELGGAERVLEVGTGSGYQTAVLAEIVKDVFTIEVVSTLSQRAQDVLKSLGYVNIQFKIGDGTRGWKDFAPYDAIMVTAAPGSVPKVLQEQLQVGGRMIIPVGVDYQELVLVRREEKTFKETRLLPVRFVPLVSLH